MFSLKILIFILFFGYTASAKNLDRRYGFWEEPPIVINCFSSPYSLKEITNSITFWKELGYEFDIIIDKFNCNGSSIPGSITIDSASQKFTANRNGETTLTIRDNNKKMINARIEILYSTEGVLEHELGHALGWKHFPYIGHIMNASDNNSGWKTNGLEINNFILK